MPKRNIVPNEERFEFIDDDELEAKRLQLKNQNTIKSDTKCENKLINYLTLKNLDTKYWLMEEAELDKILTKFWFEVKMIEGKKYTINSLTHLRYGINRCLKRKAMNMT